MSSLIQWEVGPSPPLVVGFLVLSTFFGSSARGGVGAIDCSSGSTGVVSSFSSVSQKLFDLVGVTSSDLKGETVSAEISHY